MNNYPHGIVSLTVNGDGRLSLWDSPAVALKGKEEEEVAVALTLTASQIRILIRAEVLARGRREIKR